MRGFEHCSNDIDNNSRNMMKELQCSFFGLSSVDGVSMFATKGSVHHYNAKFQHWMYYAQGLSRVPVNPQNFKRLSIHYPFTDCAPSVERRDWRSRRMVEC